MADPTDAARYATAVEIARADVEHAVNTWIALGRVAAAD